MSGSKRRYLMGLVVVLFVAVGALQTVIDPVQLKMIEAEKSKSGDANELMVQLPGQFIVASLAGFKEVIAGALWIRADTFFHKGEFAAIVPIVRLVTWLDPHNIDVFTTGAWHMDYNFVDEANSMSDKRYIPASVALLKEGIRNNPDIWDLYFELGWTHYNKKLMDYEGALYYIREATKHPGFDPNTGRKIPRQDFVDHMLAHAYEKVGKFDEAIATWLECRERVEKLLANKEKNVLVDQSSLDVIDRNLSMLYLRLGWRYGDMEAYGKGVEIAKRLADRKSPPVTKWAAEGAERDYKRRLASGNAPSDALKPLDTNFQVEWRRAASKQILIKGKINVVRSSEYKDLASEPFTHFYQDDVLKADANRKKLWRDGSRVTWRLEDYDYKAPSLDTFDWRINTNQTVIWDSLYVQGGQFSQVINFNDPRDAEMYPFAAEKYKLTVWFSPQAPTPDYVQDRIGWRGDALRDKPEVMDTKTLPGFRMLKKEFVISREEII